MKSPKITTRLPDIIRLCRGECLQVHFFNDPDHPGHCTEIVELRITHGGKEEVYTDSLNTKVFAWDQWYNCEMPEAQVSGPTKGPFVH